MNEDDLRHLLRDVVETDPAYLKAREAAWERLRANTRPSPRLVTWSIFAAAASVALVLGAIAFHSHQGPSHNLASIPPPPTTALVEIVSTRDLPTTYVEIDGPTLRQLFPRGIVIAYGQNPQVFTFDNSARSPR